MESAFVIISHDWRRVIKRLWCPPGSRIARIPRELHLTRPNPGPVLWTQLDDFLNRGNRLRPRRSARVILIILSSTRSRVRGPEITLDIYHNHINIHGLENYISSFSFCQLKYAKQVLTHTRVSGRKCSISNYFSLFGAISTTGNVAPRY